MSKSKRKYYHDFGYKNREVKLCVLVEGDKDSEAPATLSVGYSVRMPEDFPEDEDELKEGEKLGRNIAVGRARTTPIVVMRISKRYAMNVNILKGIAQEEQKAIERGEVVIKGIKEEVDNG